MNTTHRPDVVTYRLNDKMVYVTPAQSYEQALDFAQNEFADELYHIKRDRISFSVLVNAGRTHRSVRIGTMAWPAVVSGLKRYEIIDVHVQPDLYVEHVDGPPGYHQISVGVEESDKEATEFFARPDLARPPPGAKPINKRPAGKRPLKPFLRLK